LKTASPDIAPPLGTQETSQAASLQLFALARLWSRFYVTNKTKESRALEIEMDLNHQILLGRAMNFGFRGSREKIDLERGAENKKVKMVVQWFDGLLQDRSNAPLKYEVEWL
jgi:hypothetical protein